MEIVSLIFLGFFFVLFCSFFVFFCFLFYNSMVNYTRIQRDLYIFRDVFKKSLFITLEAHILVKSTLCNVPCHYQLINIKYLGVSHIWTW